MSTSIEELPKSNTNYNPNIQNEVVQQVSLQQVSKLSINSFIIELTF